ncbi:DNA mismatch repair protein MutS, C-terminal, partial [Dillenia turbinata]
MQLISLSISITKPPFHKLIRNSTSLPKLSSLSSLSAELQNETLKTLEWDSICRQLSAFTSTTMGFSAAKSAKIPIGRSLEESRKLLEQTSAAKSLLPFKLDFSGIVDVSEIVDSSIEGQLVSASELCLVKRTLKSARGLLEQLKEVSSQNGSSPLLEILGNCNFLLELEQKIEFCIDCNLSIILDRASEELELIRFERKRNMENLDSLLKRVSSEIFRSGGIDKPLITKRRSRMCVGVRASHRYLLTDGVVLDVSSSGATNFMEPKEAVELNNAEVKLSTSERAEEQAILSLLTSEMAESEMDIKDLLDRVLEIDLASAKASYAQWFNGACPIFSTMGYKNFDSSRTEYSSLIDIVGIQHPLLLEPSLESLDVQASRSGNVLQTNKENGIFSSETSSDGVVDSPVPIDIKIGSGTKVVVISGPNTGGKTASMKTLGLASIMSKAGMYLPSKSNPTLPWFDLVLADIGDHQSLEQNLSTFSGHISWICKILEVVSRDSLVLIDEIGSGTDPSEGVALSASILQYLKDCVQLAVVTTHYADLSLLKKKDSKFENAAMEFSLKSLQPTYRILWGSTGNSNALSIAKSIGFDEKVIEQAEKWVERLMPENQDKRKGLLYKSLLEERNRLEVQARRAMTLHSEIKNLYEEIQNEAHDLDGREIALTAKNNWQVHQELRIAKSQIDAVLQEFENRLKTATADQLNMIIRDSESAIASIVKANTSGYDVSSRERDNNSYVPQVGEQVLVLGLGNKLATVLEAPAEDGTLLVQYGKIRVRVDTSKIRGIPNGKRNAKSSSQTCFSKQGQRTQPLSTSLDAEKNEESLYGPAIQTSKNTVDLRGMRVEEASHHLEMIISAKGPYSVLFVIHGMGTGAVKERALEILRNHPRVTKFEQESPMNYGCTVAYI